MLRGDKALMGIISNDLSTTADSTAKECSTTDRDNALTCRFYYYGRLLAKRYDVCLVELSKEFYLSENVIVQRLMERQGFLKQLMSNNTKAKDLALLYPYYSWKV